MHGVMLIVTFYGEIYENKFTGVAHVMKFLKIVAIAYMTYRIIMLYAINIYINTVFEAKYFSGYNKLGIVPKCFINDENTRKALGNSTEWLLIEAVIFTTYYMTFLLYMVRSRFISVGKSHKHMFEPVYMSYLVNRICNAIDFKEGTGQLLPSKELQ